MSLFEAFRVALDTLRAHKLRSFLTMLGVIIGVMAVVVMVAMIEGARATVVKEFEQLGSDLILVVFDPSRRLARGERGGTVEGLRMEDAEGLRTLPRLRLVTPERNLGQKELVHKTEKMNAQVIGVESNYLLVRAFQIEKGRFISEQDLREGAKVAVLGAEVARKLFGNTVPLRRDLLIEGTLVRVVGVLKKKGRSFDENLDEIVFLPITAVFSRWAGDRYVSMILAVPKSRAESKAAMEEIWEWLMRHHHNQPDFRVDSLESILAAIGRVLTIFGALLGGIAGLSLLVGGIGIMNIMLVSVTERTREIGLRKAVGAKQVHILLQFLIESATLSAIGGLIGMGFGWGVSETIEWISKQSDLFGDQGIQFYFPLWAALLAFGFSAFVGMAFGLYPAWRAARLDPIVALRHE